MVFVDYNPVRISVAFCVFYTSKIVSATFAAFPAAFDTHIRDNFYRALRADSYTTITYTKARLINIFCHVVVPLMRKLKVENIKEQYECTSGSTEV